MELADEPLSNPECEELYEESLWCLYALQDDTMQSGNPFQKEDKVTISSCKWSTTRKSGSLFILIVMISGIDKTKKRLVSHRNKRLLQEAANVVTATTPGVFK